MAVAAGAGAGAGDNSNPVIQEAIEHFDPKQEGVKLGWFKGRVVTRDECVDNFPDALKNLKEEVAKLGYDYDMDKPFLDNLAGWANQCLSDRTVQPFSDKAQDVYDKLTKINSNMDEDVRRGFGLTDSERVLAATKYRGLVPETLRPENAAVSFWQLKNDIEDATLTDCAESTGAAGRPMMGLGIENGGGGCWFNAALKCLIHTIDFQALSVSLAERIDIHPQVKEVASLLAQLREEHESVKNEETHAFFRSDIPNRIRSVLYEFCRDTMQNADQSLFPQPYNNEQRDAGELVAFLFDLFCLKDNKSMSLTNKKDAFATHDNKELKKQLESESTAVPIIIVPTKESPEVIVRKVITRESGLTLPVELKAAASLVDSEKGESNKAPDEARNIVETVSNVMQPCSDEMDDDMDVSLVQGAEKGRKDRIVELLMQAGATEIQAKKLADDECAIPVTMRDGLAATLGDEVRPVKWSPENLANHGLAVEQELELETRMSSRWQIHSTELKQLFVMFNLFSYQNHASGKNTEETKEMFLDGGDPIYLPVEDQNGNQCQVKGTPRSIICHTGELGFGHYITLSIQDDGSVIVEDDATVVKLDDYQGYEESDGVKGFFRDSNYSPYMVCYDCEVIPGSDLARGC